MQNTPLKLSKYRFTLEAIDPITLPNYKGSTFHGGFGHALMQISPTWYRYFFEPKNKQNGNNAALPKPYVILPPLDNLEHYPKGHQFHLELTLIGEATQHYSIAQAAIEYLGHHMGLGRNKAKYKIISIDRAIASQQNADSNQHSVYSDEIINTRIPTLNNEQITIHFPTRLRLKQNNRLSRQPPNFATVFERIAGRIKTLSNAYGENAEGDTPHSLENYKTLKTAAQHITIQQQNLKWQEWHRYSGTGKQHMKFGGLTGDITYQGDLKPFLPWLALGEWIHIGGKTSFGLGKYIIE